MRCLQCNGEMTEAETEADARLLERLRIAMVAERSAQIMRERGDSDWKALDDFAQALFASRGI